MVYAKRKYKKKYKRRYKKKTYGKKKRASRAFSNRPTRGMKYAFGWGKTPAAIPATMQPTQVVRFKQCEVFDLDPSDTDNVTDTVISLNDITDPFRTLLASQPLGLDQWSDWYVGHRTLSCHANVRFDFLTMPAAQAMVCGLMPSEDSTSLPVGTDWTTWCEYPRVQHKETRPRVGALTGQAMGLEFNYDYTYKTWKPRSGLAKEDFIGALAHGSPTALVFLHILASRLLPGDIGANVTYRMTVRLTWYVELTQRRRFLAASVDA